MEVLVNTPKAILKSFIGWLPLALAVVPFYGMLFFCFIMYILTNFEDLDQKIAVKIALILGVLLLLISIYAYLNWLIKSLSSYRLVTESDNLIIKGIAGWSSLDKVVAIQDIEKIFIGEYANSLEKLSLNHGAVMDQVTSRLTFVPYEGKTFKLDFATKAFDNESLCNFLIFIKDKGVYTNVNV